MKAWTLAAAALAIFGLGAPDFSADADSSAGLRTIIVGTSYPGVDEMPIYIGQKFGYFSKEHVAVELLSLSTGDKIVYALLGGSLNVARYTPDWIIRADERGGNKLKLVLGSSNNLIFSLIAGDAVRTYADLKGKRIGVSTLAAADATLVKKMLAAHGLHPGDYTLIPAGASPQRAAALRAGSLAATVLTPPVDLKMLEAGGFHRLDLSTNVVKHYAWGGQAVQEDWAKANKALLVAYMRAWIEGDRWLHDPANKEEAISLLASKTKTAEKYARAEYDLYFGPSAVPVPADGELDPIGYQALISDMTAAGQLSPPPPKAEKFFDVTYWTQAEKSLSQSHM